MYNNTEKTITNPEIINPVDSIITRICTSNGIDKNKIKLHIIESTDVNAFALPDNHLVILSGLILQCENEAELSGIISHEIAHMELNHVMKKLVKELGMSVIISMSSGKGGGDLIKKSLKLLSSTAFDRKLEKEADIKAVDYLFKAKINPDSFANFMYKLSEKEPTIQKQMSWISTHPNSKERAEYIKSYSKNKPRIFTPILNKDSWSQLMYNMKLLEDEKPIELKK